MNLDLEISVEYGLDKFHAHSPQVGHHRIHHVEFRNHINAWLYEENLNLFPAISDPICWHMVNNTIEKYQKIKHACCVVDVCVTLYPLEFFA